MSNKRTTKPKPNPAKRTYLTKESAISLDYREAYSKVRSCWYYYSPLSMDSLINDVNEAEKLKEDGKDQTHAEKLAWNREVVANHLLDENKEATFTEEDVGLMGSDFVSEVARQVMGINVETAKND